MKQHKGKRNYTTTIKYVLKESATILATCDQKDGSVRSILSEGVDCLEKSYLYKSKDYRNKVRKDRIKKEIKKDLPVVLKVVKSASKTGILPSPVSNVLVPVLDLAAPMLVG